MASMMSMPIAWWVVSVNAKPPKTSWPVSDACENAIRCNCGFTWCWIISLRISVQRTNSFPGIIWKRFTCQPTLPGSMPSNLSLPPSMPQPSKILMILRIPYVDVASIVICAGAIENTQATIAISLDLCVRSLERHQKPDKPRCRKGFVTMPSSTSSPCGIWKRGKPTRRLIISLWE